MSATQWFADLSGKLYVDGAFVSSKAHETFEVIDPATEARLGTIADAMYYSYRSRTSLPSYV